MQSKFLVKFLTVTVLVFSLNLNAQHEEHDGKVAEQDIKTEIKESINHHIQDSYDFIFFSDSEKNKHYGFPLPVILIDEGLHLFSSSKFHHGETVAESNGKYYKLYHNKIYRTDAEGTLTLDDHHHPTNIKPLDFSITKGVLMIIITGVLMLMLFGGLAKSFTKGPIATGAGRFFEPIIVYIRDDIAIEIGSYDDIIILRTCGKFRRPNIDNL